MSSATINAVQVRSITATVPSRVRRNVDIGNLEQIDYVERISSLVGVSERRVVSPDQYGSDLAKNAFARLLDSLEWEPDSVDLLVVATQTPDRLFPGMSFQIHREFELSRQCVAFDVNLGCSAFTHGLWITATLLKNLGKRAVLINVDTMSRVISPLDLGNQVLFGDAATATALEISEIAKPMFATLLSDGKGTESVCLPDSGMGAKLNVVPFFSLNGPAVLGLALREVPKLIESLLSYAEISIDEINTFVPHQANTFILQKLFSKLQISLDRAVVEMDKFGNTSSASIPLALCAHSSSFKEQNLQRTLVVGFGTGFSLSALVLDLGLTKLTQVHQLD